MFAFVSLRNVLYFANAVVLLINYTVNSYG